MNIKKEVPQQDSDRTPVTFRDVAAWFSEEEWSLLQEWQKELYRRVMTEIHQALISLGYQIVNPDILIQVDRRHEATIQGPQDIEKVHNNGTPPPCYPAIYPEMLLRIKQVEEPYCCYRYNAEESAVSNSASKAGGISSSKMLFSIKREENLHLKDHQDTEGRESNECTSAGDEIMSRKRKSEDSVNTEKIIQSGNTGQAKEKEIQNYEKRMNSMTQLWSDTNQKLGGEKTTLQKTGVCNLENSNICQGIPKVETHDKHHECKSKLSNEKCLACLTNTIENWSPYVGTENDNSISQKIVNTPERTHVCKKGKKETQLGDINSKTERPYQCTKCEKSFNHKGHLNRHFRTHMETRPYQCTECKKSFSEKGNLVRHFRLHTGDTPFQCTECDKSFSQKGNLVHHQKKHTGEKPYQCTECVKSFSQKGHLAYHQKTHLTTRVKPYECVECVKGFGTKGALIRHLRLHTGEREGKVSMNKLEQEGLYKIPRDRRGSKCEP